MSSNLNSVSVIEIVNEALRATVFLLFQYARSTTNAWDATNGVQISSTAS